MVVLKDMDTYLKGDIDDEGNHSGEDDHGNFITLLPQETIQRTRDFYKEVNFPVYADPPADIRPSVIEALAAMGTDWQERFSLLYVKAFPEYEGWTIEQMFECELQQMEFVRREYPQALLRLFEGMSGKAGISAVAELFFGMRVAACDIKYGNDMNILTGEGLRLWRMNGRLVGDDCDQWIAPTCCSWIWAANYQSGRTAENMDGDVGKAFVVDANTTKDIVIGLVLMNHLANVRFTIEQPMSSKMFKHRNYQALVNYTGAKRTLVWHGAYDNGSAKPFQLFSTSTGISSLARPMPEKGDRGEALMSKDADGNWFGKRRRLSRSAHYSPIFGFAVAESLG